MMMISEETTTDYIDCPAMKVWNSKKDLKYHNPFDNMIEKEKKIKLSHQIGDIFFLDNQHEFSQVFLYIYISLSKD